MTNPNPFVGVHVYSATGVGAIVAALVHHSAAFHVTPMPDDVWIVEVKPEHEAMVLNIRLQVRATSHALCPPSSCGESTREDARPSFLDRFRPASHNATCQLVTGDCSYCTCGAGYPKAPPAYAVEELLADPSTPFWASDLIRLLTTKDPVDAVNTLEVVTRTFRARLDRLQERRSS